MGGYSSDKAALEQHEKTSERGSRRIALNLPNKLTLARFVLTFIFILLLSYENVATYSAAYVVFLVATITDYYDGKIARSRNLVTNFGKLMDPVADKVLISAAFIMLMLMGKDLYIPGWTVVVVIGREFLVTGARSLAASEGMVIGANRWGKTKAVFQMVYVYCFLGFVVLKELAIAAQLRLDYSLISSWLRWTSLFCAIAVAVYTVYSGVQFARINWGLLRLGEER
jgi:CDP-diacylglycerol--glycerol-3-phosphate 3-phosphatidyltransferase